MTAERLIPTAVIAAAGALALGFAVRGGWIFLPLVIALGLGWGYSASRGGGVWVEVMNPLAFIAIVGCAAIGLLINAPPMLMAVAVVAALVAWDLTHFQRRLRGHVRLAHMRVERVAEIERRHLRWLLIAGVGGLTAAALAFTLRAELSFGAMFAIGLLAAVTLSGLIAALKRG